MGETAKGASILRQPDFIIQTIRGEGYVVTDMSGKWMTTPSKFHVQVDGERARLQSLADAKAKRGARPCMCCHASFESEGIHHRMCNRCRGVSCALGDPVRPQIARRA